MLDLSVSDTPKMLRETLCVAQTAVGQFYGNGPRVLDHINSLQRLVDECDRHRPLGPDGTHGDRHTKTCGCDVEGAPLPTAPEGELAALRAEIDQLRAGEDDTPLQENLHGRPAQFLYRLNRMTGAERLRWLDHVQAMQETATRCSGFLSHAQKIDDLKFERDRLAERVRELEGRPTRHAFDEVCRTVELQRAELVGALGGELQPSLIPWGDAVQQVRTMHAVRQVHRLEADMPERLREALDDKS